MNQANILLHPVKTEKSTAFAKSGKFTFLVNSDASKHQIKDAVEKSFGVTVDGVKTIHTGGKYRRFGKITRKLSDTKKAVVTLPEGQTIELFDLQKKGKKGGKKK